MTLAKSLVLDPLTWKIALANIMGTQFSIILQVFMSSLLSPLLLAIPPLTLSGWGLDFGNGYILIVRGRGGDVSYASADAATNDGALVIAYHSIFTGCINFIVALVAVAWLFGPLQAIANENRSAEGSLLAGVESSPDIEASTPQPQPPSRAMGTTGKNADSKESSSMECPPAQESYLKEIARYELVMRQLVLADSSPSVYTQTQRAALVSTRDALFAVLIAPDADVHGSTAASMCGIESTRQ